MKDTVAVIYLYIHTSEILHVLLKIQMIVAIRRFVWKDSTSNEVHILLRLQSHLRTMSQPNFERSRGHLFFWLFYFLVFASSFCRRFSF